MQKKRMKADYYYYSLGLKIAASEAFTIPNRMQILVKSSMLFCSKKGCIEGLLKSLTKEFPFVMFNDFVMNGIEI